MKPILFGALATVALGVTGAATIATFGLVDVAADSPHHPVVHEFLEFSRERAIAGQLGDIKPPDNLGSPDRIRRGAGNYDAMCVNCHLAPELADSEIRKGLYPSPPNLSAAAPGVQRHPARDFWIIKHGIKASGMPAWSKAGMDDEAIWDITAFLQAMPSLSRSAYTQLVAASDGHTHDGADAHAANHGGQDGRKAPPLASNVPQSGNATKAAHAHPEHEHGTHKH